MAATAHFNATEAAASILREGGNAVDAAVAAAFALGVCEPAASGLGGQTMALLYLKERKQTVALDGSSRAPHRVPPGELEKKELLRGHRAATVPSTPAVLGYLIQRYGTLPLSRVLEPAIQMAEEGFRVTELMQALTQREIRHLRAGSAATLFIHDDMVANEGFIRDDDLAQIPWPIERKPLACRFDGLRVHTFGEPGAGRTLVEILNVIDKFPASLKNPDTPRGALLFSEVIRRANIDRRDRPFDPHFYPQVETKRMLSDEYATLMAKQVRSRIKTRGDTTHLSVMDEQGNVVALTQSIERVFGSFEASPKLGFLYNNYMSAFEYTDITHPNYLRPAAVPWASVAPTIAFRGSRPWLAIGSPGRHRVAGKRAYCFSHSPGTRENAVSVALRRRLCPEAALFR
jgi:gamma-glutamyltranspeptidase/glutathione hydrolase